MAKRSPLALAVLALLVEAPMHPYLIQRLLKERGKHRVINLGQRATFYKTIIRLQRDGLVAVRETVRHHQRPERTVYVATEEGRAVVVAWMREMLSTPRMEFPEFPAAIAYLPLLAPKDAMRQLETRRTRLQDALAEQKAGLDAAPRGLPRLFLLEEEYLRAITRAELAWVTSVIDDLRAGRVTWSPEWLAEVAARFARKDKEPRKRGHT
ncbi:MAG TPA: PadR family transcriptional regulator [Candidatus Methylomirabilis sp.]|nr:PadR family transcriptional regulator [Candidatus Methylomirabilis sp.]